MEPDTQTTDVEEEKKAKILSGSKLGILSYAEGARRVRHGVQLELSMVAVPVLHNATSLKGSWRLVTCRAAFRARRLRENIH